MHCAWKFQFYISLSSSCLLLLATHIKHAVSLAAARWLSSCLDCSALKLLSVDPQNYPDAPREGIRRILEQLTGKKHPRDEKLDTSRISSIRMGTTVSFTITLHACSKASICMSTSCLVSYCMEPWNNGYCKSCLLFQSYSYLS